MVEDSLDSWFDGKPGSYEQFSAVRRQIEACGPSELTVGKQISFGRKRKFAWFWLYNVTSRTPQGVLHVQLAMAEKVDDGHVRNHTRIGENRWNHQIVIRSLADARSVWLRRLIERSYDYGAG